MSDKAGTKSKKRRIRVPDAVKISLYTESGYRCAVPNCRGIIALDMHHIVHVEEGGGNDESNLLPLCPTCHALYHRGEIKQESIKAWKLILMSISNAFDRKAIDVLLLLDSDAEVKERGLYVSGDGLLDCASLVSSGYVGSHGIRSEARGSSGGRYLAGAYYILKLTRKGELFVQGWKTGDLSARDHIDSDTG